MEHKEFDPNDWQGRREDQVRGSAEILYWTAITGGILFVIAVILKLIF